MPDRVDLNADEFRIPIPRICVLIYSEGQTRREIGSFKSFNNDVQHFAFWYEGPLFREILEHPERLSAVSLDGTYQIDAVALLPDRDGIGVAVSRTDN